MTPVVPTSPSPTHVTYQELYHTCPHLKCTRDTILDLYDVKRLSRCFLSLHLYLVTPRSKRPGRDVLRERHTRVSLAINICTTFERFPFKSEKRKADQLQCMRYNIIKRIKYLLEIIIDHITQYDISKLFINSRIG